MGGKSFITSSSIVLSFRGKGGKIARSLFLFVVV